MNGKIIPFDRFRDIESASPIFAKGLGKIYPARYIIVLYPISENHKDLEGNLVGGCTIDLDDGNLTWIEKTEESSIESMIDEVSKGVQILSRISEIEFRYLLNLCSLSCDIFNNVFKTDSEQINNFNRLIDYISENRPELIRSFKN